MFTVGKSDVSLSETASVTEMNTENAGVIIAQFFASSPYAHVTYKNGQVYLFVHPTGTIPLFSNVPLGATFQFTLSQRGTTLTISGTYKGQTVTKSVQEDSSFVGQSAYMKAGDYQQATSSSGPKDETRVIISSLSTNGT